MIQNENSKEREQFCKGSKQSDLKPRGKSLERKLNFKWVIFYLNIIPL